MKEITSQEFRRLGQEAQDMLEEHGKELTSEQREFYEVRAGQAEVHAKVEALYGTFNVVVEQESNSRMAACVDPSTETKSISLSTLDPSNLSWAYYAGAHEGLHVKTRMYHNIPMDKDIANDHMAVLKHSLKTSDLKVNITEGFIDWMTREQQGENNNSGYKEEVRVAKALDEVTKKETGISMLELYKTGNKEAVKHTIRKTTDLMLGNEALNNLKMEKGGLANAKCLKAVEAAMAEKLPPVYSLADARRVIGKMYDEEVKIEAARSGLRAA